jgi:hypothetical protein
MRKIHWAGGLRIQLSTFGYSLRLRGDEGRIDSRQDATWGDARAGGGAQSADTDG